MRIFQIFGGFCHWDATAVLPSIADAKERFASDIVFAEAPDYVREGWGYDPSAEGDARFIRPTPPAGWEYDDATGTFYRPEDLENETAGDPDIWDELAAAYTEGVESA